eukprot:Sspe_Gene.77793::Locus_48628_Transcript_1_1_Confidence_1.000_Length_571::g.77793::m.77793
MSPFFSDWNSGLSTTCESDRSGPLVDQPSLDEQSGILFPFGDSSAALQMDSFVEGVGSIFVCLQTTDKWSGGGGKRGAGHCCPPLEWHRSRVTRLKADKYYNCYCWRHWGCVWGVCGVCV